MLGLRLDRLPGRSAPPLRPLTVGDAAPSFAFTDLYGVRGHIADLEGWVVVYTAADRDSSGKLMDWQREVGLDLVRRFPHLKIAYVNIADVSMVPSMMRGVVEPVLRHISAGAQKELAANLAARGVVAGADAFRLYLVPDWSGEHLAALRVADASSFRVWVASQGRIAGVWTDGRDGEMSTQFTRVFERLAREGVSN